MLKQDRAALFFIRLFEKIRMISFLPDILSLLGIFLYALRAFYLARFSTLNMDEGIYLMKGWLFIQGKYLPYQVYGPFTQKMPLSYYLFGLAEYLFGPGLRTGRFLAAACGVLAVIGVWLLTRRLGGKWVAVLPVLYMLLNRIGILYYDRATTQAIVACLGSWALFFTVGGKQKPWQVVIGAIFSGLTIITRHETLPFTVLLLLYIFWEYGRRTGLASLLAVGIVVLVPHILFWPGILSLWSLVPRSLAPFLDEWRITSFSTLAHRASYPFDTELKAVWEGVCYFFVPIIGALCSLFLSPRQKSWRQPEKYKAYVFLAATWLVMLPVHFYAAFFMNYGIYQFAPYLAFFHYIGLLLAIVSYRSWILRAGFWKQAFLFVLLAFIVTITGYVRAPQLKSLFEFPLPRIVHWHIESGEMTVVSILCNKFHLRVETVEQILPPVSAFLFFLLLVAGGALLANRLKKGAPLTIALVAMLVFSFVVTPGAVLGQGHPEMTCSFDAFQADEQVGAAIAKSIPYGARIFWYPSSAPTSLLYVPGLRLFPQQLDNRYNYVIGGEEDAVARLGYWNDALQATWLAQSDYVMILSDEYGQKINEFRSGIGKGYQLDEVNLPRIPLSCQDRTLWIVHIYKIVKNDR